MSPANYDGFAKHRTVIGAGASIGSNCVLVAPVSVGAGAVVGAANAITKDVALERSEQTELAGGTLKSSVENVLKVQRALEGAGVVFIDQNEEGGPGVRLTNPI